ncbi:MAG TPA: peptide ABC transporter substrate-binding protein [Pyrinomonadaceae bacterium]|jgi:ABC-type oligopeptide transport system substrate-binding subunit
MGKRRVLKLKGRLESWRAPLALLLMLSFALSGGGCFLDHEPEPYYGRVVAPRAQEFRWSDGGLPQTFDPALAAVPPDTDAVRALFEGLTDYDPKTLAPVPAVAARWEASPDGREWTFYLRKDARWTNGDPVTARDFVRSWQRTLQLGERAPHARLMENIQGARPLPQNPASPTVEPQSEQSAQAEAASAKPLAKPDVRQETKKESQPEAAPQPKFGAEALGDYVLRVRLEEADKNFPALVAHPVFRPVHEETAPASSPDTSRVISNGAFQLSRTDGQAVVLERAMSYWDAAAVKLQRVHFVAAQDAETALAAYRAGEVDAVTNAGFEPLALKLLAPYKDFHRSTYAALAYYSFNTSHAPFDDVRVREALSIAIDRERLSQDELGGATEPATRFLPTGMSTEDGAESKELRLLGQDAARARKLLADAGFPEGKGFPRIRLLINRNDQQRQVAQSVSAMWRTILGVETEIIIKTWDEYEAAVRAGDYDIARRGAVMQTTDEATIMRLLFEQGNTPILPDSPATQTEAQTTGPEDALDKKLEEERRMIEKPAAPPHILSEAQALKELRAMPLYFASSYSLVKPFVTGFDSNLLDAPSLKRVGLDTAWRAPQKSRAVWLP